MKDYTVDTQTGYLTPGPLFVGKGFTATEKALFIETFSKTANLSKAAKMVGVDRQVISQHFEHDIAFYKAYRHAVDLLCDDVEESLYKMAKKNASAGLNFLKAYRPGIWSEKKQIEGSDKATDKLKGILDGLKKEGKLIDTEEAK